MSIKILLADDHKITRQGLSLLINNQPDMEVVAEAANGREAVELADKLAPKVIIMDVSMPDLNGIQATRQIKAKHAGIRVIALSMHSDALFVSEMLKCGASGYLLKDCAFDELIQAIRVVFRDKTYLSPAVTGVVVDDYLHKLTNTGSSSQKTLTERESEILQLVAEGNSTKQTALKLHISTKTVETHRRQIMNKLDIFTVAELTKYAIKQGFTSLET